jgi:hypothetical protein
MSNTLLTIADITNEGLMLLENDLTLADKINREYDDRFGVDGAKIGYTVNVRKPARFKGTAGPALNVEDFVESSIPVTLTNQFHVDTQFITSDLLLSMDMFSKRVLKPKIAAIANRIDFDIATAMRINTPNIVGTAGTAPTTLAPFLLAGALLDTEAVPRDGERCMVLDQFSQSTMVGALTGLFNPQAQIGEQYKKGLMSKATVGFDWYMDQNITSQTFATLAGTPQFSTTGTSSALLTSGWADSGTMQTKGWTASTAVLNVGDVFSIANVLMVNPQNRAAAGSQVRYFVVRPPVGTPSNGTFAATTDIFGNVTGGTYTSDSGGLLQVTVANACISAGQFQNVNAAPVNSAAITLYASNKVSPQSLAFHRDSFTLVSADLPLPGGVDMAARASHKDVGVSIRVVRQYTINNDALPTRLDVLYGVAPLYRELACRVAG